MREKLITEVFNYGEIKTKNTAIIMEEIKLSNNQITYIPSALNQMLYKKYYNKSINSAKNIGYTICEFLNYVDETTSLGEDEKFTPLKTKGLYGLNFYHLASFLNYCILTKGNGYDTIKQKEKRLISLYEYLISAELLDKNVKLKYKMILGTDNRRHKLQLSPFNMLEYPVRYPSKNANKTIKLNNLEEHLYQLLIELSEKYTPNITFGIVLQIMGGFRKGEVVNLRIQDLILDKNRNKITARLNDHPELFNDRNIDISKSEVKKVRNQTIFNIDGSLYEHYENYIKYRAKFLSKKKTFTEALLIDSDGQSMSGSTYEQHFQKLKDIFLDKLKENSYSTFLAINDTKWGTHICRGIFTNICIQHGYAKNIRDLANLRGDFSEDASKVYWDTARLSKSIDEKLNILNNFDEN